MSFFIPYILAQGIYTGVITGISTLTWGTCKLIGSIYTHKNPNVDEHIKKFDLERRLNLIQAVISKFDIINTEKNQQKEKIGNKTIIIKTLDDKNDPIQICLNDLHQCIQAINIDINEINNIMIYHESKMFSSWRVLNIKRQLKSLEVNSNNLEKRFDDFIKITNFCHDNKLN
jgi:hypothetical protein